MVGLIGPNGAGKTTLVNVMTGFDFPTSGSVVLGDELITAWSPHRRGRAGLARTFLKQYCHHCHGVDFQSPGLDVLDHGSLVSLRDREGAPFLVPGRPGRSARRRVSWRPCAWT